MRYSILIIDEILPGTSLPYDDVSPTVDEIEALGTFIQVADFRCTGRGVPYMNEVSKHPPPLLPGKFKFNNYPV